MLHVILIEDAPLIAREIVEILHEIPQVRVKAVLHSVQDTLDYMKTEYSFEDLIISDIQLSDGLSFDIFSQLNLFPPVIFITGHNDYMPDVFKFNSVDFLLKPIDPAELHTAISKYRKMEDTFFERRLYKNFSSQQMGGSKTRVIARRGIENVVLDIHDVILFYKENGIVLVLDKEGKKYMIDNTLSDLEQDFKRSGFFRVNRQFLVNARYVRGYKSFERVKLQVSLSINPLSKDIIVSQENSRAFKQWLSNV